MTREEMLTIARGWSQLADEYVAAIYDELQHKPFDREWLAEFASMVPVEELVWELGCGPGHITAHLNSLGVRAKGFDLSPEMIAQARRITPKLEFAVGNILEMTPDGLGGAAFPYALINLVREDVPVVLERFAKGMLPGAPLYISVHAGEGVVEESEVLGRPVRMVATLFTLGEMERYVRDAGFQIVRAAMRAPYEQEYPSERVYVLGRMPA